MSIDLKKLKVMSINLYQPVSMKAPSSPFKTIDPKRVPGVELTLSSNGVFAVLKDEVILIPFQNLLSVKMEPCVDEGVITDVAKPTASRAAAKAK